VASDPAARTHPGRGFRLGAGPRATLAFEASTPALAGVDDLLVELEMQASAGEPLRLESCLERLEDPDPASRVELIYHAFCLEEEVGRHPDPAAYLARFPDDAATLGRVLGLHAALDATVLTDALAPSLPEPGDEVGPYRLLRLLGQGAFARVFLAEQTDLDDRLVVVKLSARRDLESRLLARVEHPHVMTVLRQATVADGSLALLCMPFLGGATLAEVLIERRRLRGLHRRPRRGREWLDALDRVSAPERGDVDSRSAIRERLARLDHTQAVAWMGARLAEALDHAHRRGVVHGDVKPSNILLAADGRPLLFDFNLAATTQAGDPGGTLAYMPPERLRRIAANPRDGVAPPTRERVRGDLYALGLVLAEWAGGLGPQAESPPTASSETLRTLAGDLASRRCDGAWLDERLRGVPPRLRPVVAACLAPDPADRYASASRLADELDRLADSPGARRAGTWPARAAMLAIGLGSLIAAGAWWSERRGADRARIEEAQGRLESLWAGALPGVYRVSRLSRTVDSVPKRQLGALLAEGEELRRELAGTDRLPYLDPVQRQDLELWYTEQAWRQGRDVDRDREGEGEALSQAAMRGQLLPGEAADGPVSAWKATYLEGLEAERGGDYERALDRYGRLLDSTPHSLWLNFRVAVASSRLGDIVTAIQHLEFCLRQQPDSDELRVAMAGLLHYLGRDEQALAELERLGPGDRGGDVRTLNLVFVQEGLGQTAAARASLARLGKISPADPAHSPWATRLVRRHLENATSLLRLDDLNLPEKLTLHGAAVGDLDARLVLAGCYRDRGEFRHARILLDSILRENPRHLHAQYAKGLMLRWTGEREEADALLKNVVLQPGFSQLLLAGGDAGFALELPRWLAADAADQGRPEEAEHFVRLGEDRVRWLESLGIPGQREHLQAVRAGYAYSLARIFARRDLAAGGADPGRVRRQLGVARDLLPGQVPIWLAKDRLMASYR
jgi:serine/threonine protein kinase/tetratricopeptide (TPR) repeat protein